MRRRQIMVATSSIGPGALNMVTAAGVAHADRLPVLLLSGDTFAGRIPDPVLQQVEHFDDPTTTVNDAFRPVTRYWDRITRPAQLLQSLPQALGTMLDPAACGPAFLGLSQDAQAEAFDFPVAFFEPRCTGSGGPGRILTEEAARILRAAERPLLIAGGGVHYSEATGELAAFATRHAIPVVETVAGKSSLPGTTRWSPADRRRREHVGQRARAGGRRGPRGRDAAAGLHHGVVERVRGRGAPADRAERGRYDATKHLAAPLVADAKRGSRSSARRSAGGARRPRGRRAPPVKRLERGAGRDRRGAVGERSPYAAVIRTINDLARGDDYVVVAAGGLPGELNKHWRSLDVGTFDCEYGFSCMGYEIGGAWGAAMALPDRTVVSFCGDGSYLMANSELYGSILSGHPFVLILCDNGGYAVIDRLQVFKGAASFRNMLPADVRVDLAAHAAAMRDRGGVLARGAWGGLRACPRRRPDHGDRDPDRPARLDRRRRVVGRRRPRDLGARGGAGGQGGARGRAEAPTDGRVTKAPARGSRRRHPTIVDVAERAGVSKSSCPS